MPPRVKRSSEKESGCGTLRHVPKVAPLDEERRPSALHSKVNGMVWGNDILLHAEPLGPSD